MTGHHHDKQSRGANPLRTAHPDLDQHAAALAHARTTNDPMIKDLAQVEPTFITELLRRLNDVDPTTIGAVLLIAGNLAGQVLDHLPEPHQPQGGPILANLLQLAGQQLYTAKVPSKASCPFLLNNGKPCLHTATADNDEQLAAVVRGHMALHHPEQAAQPAAEIYERTLTAEDLGAQALPPAPEGWRDIARQPVVPFERTEGRQYQRDEDLFPPTALGPNPTFDELQRFACVRVLAVTKLKVDKQVGDPFTGKVGELTPEAAWSKAEREYELILADHPDYDPTWSLA